MLGRLIAKNVGIYTFKKKTLKARNAGNSLVLAIFGRWNAGIHTIVYP